MVPAPRLAHHLETPALLAGGGIGGRRDSRLATLIIAGVAVLYLVYLIWFSPYELVGDEAYYWAQARHLDLGYNEKGPLLAWMIAASCAMFGDTEWAVRLPVLVSFIVAAWGIGRLSMAVAGGDQRVGLLAVACFFLMPAFQANAQICTQDGPLIALWVGLTAVGLRLLRRWRRDENTWLEWLSLWVLLGVGALLKHTVVLFLMGLALNVLLTRNQLTWRATFLFQQIAGVAVFILLICPMIIWNARHGWPMLEHTIGHLGLGGDQAGLVNRGNPLTWLASTVGGIAGAFGPAAVALAVWACIWAWKRRKEDPLRWADRLWIMCAAWPGVLFFVLLSLFKPVVPSWPLPHFVPLVVLMAEFTVAEWPRTRHLRRVLAVYGIGGWALIAFPTLLRELPVVGPKLDRSVSSRFTGHSQAAATLESIIEQVRTRDGRPPLIVTSYYMQAALDSFYLPGHPLVSTAGKYLGKRSTTFDQWNDTRLDNPALYGRSVLLCGQSVARWREALIFDEIEPTDGSGILLARNYRGPRQDHPSQSPGDD